MIRFLMLAIVVTTSAIAIWQVTAAEPAPAAAKLNTSVDECRVCHSWDGNTSNADQPLRGYLALVPGISAKNASDKFICLNESLTWDRHDPHTLAFRVLRDAREMNEKLKKNDKITPRFTDITTDARCLSCHAMDLNPKAVEKPLANFVRGDIGIGCSGCHGHGRDWQTSHYSTAASDPSIVEWRLKTPKEKGDCGQRNLRDPQVKAALCASCHVGNAEEGKVVTHDMYVAGHPPLPPLELLTYSRDEPMHWKSPFHLDYFKTLKPDEALAKFSVRLGEGEGGYNSRHVALGFLASLKSEVAMLAADARTREPNNPIDFARFDCYACHHELKLPSDRQVRGYDHAPGRPPLRAWVQIGVKTVLDYLADTPDSEAARAAAGFDELWRKLRMAATNQPFGTPGEVIAAAGDLVKWCDALQVALEKTDAFAAPGFEAAVRKKLNEPGVRAEPEAMMALVWASKSLNKDADWSKAAAILPISLRSKEQVWSPENKPVAVGLISPDRLKLFYKYSASQFDAAYPK